MDYYMMFGVKITVKVQHMPSINDISFTERINKAYDFLDAFEEGTSNIDVVHDDMFGRYICVGKILFYSGDIRNDDSFAMIDLDKLPDIEKQFRETFANDFPDYLDLIDVDFKLFAFVHYS